MVMALAALVTVMPVPAVMVARAGLPAAEPIRICPSVKAAVEVAVVAPVA